MERTPISLAVRPQNSKCTVEGNNVGLHFTTLHKHARSDEDFFLLATCLGLEVSDAARMEIGVHKFALASAETDPGPLSVPLARKSKASQSPTCFRRKEI
jgi:hypothetical protein